MDANSLPQSPASRPPRILVVDDEPDTCHNLKDILSDSGFEVDTACDGPSALKLVKQTSYDVALLDLKMPGMDGLELYQRIKGLRSDTVAIIVTAYASSDTARTALRSGAWQVLSKPVNLSRLMDLIGEALDQPLVMLVDDDQELCASLWDVLREHGFRVALAHDVEQGAALLQDQRFDVVLIDLKLPRVDGGEMFRLVREMSPQSRTVLITGYRSEMEQRVQEAMQEGADAVCYKPFDLDLLIRQLRQLTDQHHT